MMRQDTAENGRGGYAARASRSIDASKSFLLLCAGLLALALSCAATLVQAGGAGVIPGTNYRELSDPQPVEAAPGTVEVIEFLWYDCQTCFVVEPALERWVSGRKGDITFRRMPAMVGGHMTYFARAFYTAEALGVLDRIHFPLYNAVHRHGRPLAKEEELAAFFAEHGVDRGRFFSIFRSSATAAKVRNAQIMSRRYDLAGAPTFIVNGKYRVDPSMAANAEALLQVVDFLVDRELKAARR